VARALGRGEREHSQPPGPSERTHSLATVHRGAICGGWRNSTFTTFSPFKFIAHDYTLCESHCQVGFFSQQLYIKVYIEQMSANAG